METNYKNILKGGTLNILDVDIPCYVTEDEKRLLSASKLQTLLRVDETSDGDLTKITRNFGTRWTRFLSQKWVLNLIDDEFDKDLLIPIRAKSGGKRITGYQARLLPQLLRVVIKANREGRLTSVRQLIIAEQCEIVRDSLADLAIDAVVDEATGYQYIRNTNALQLLLNKYIAEGMQKWVKVFPDRFFELLDKLYGREKSTPKNRPQFYGNFINDYIYNPIEKGYPKKEANRLNINDDGTRKGRFHQWFTDEGKDVLKEQLYQVMGLMTACRDKKTFDAIWQREEAKLSPSLFPDEVWDEIYIASQGIK